MIYVDDRTGSKELYRYFPQGSAQLTRLQSADFAWTGHHESGDVLVGVERKRIGDFINSMCTGRLSGKQLIGMLNAYHHVYLVLEGLFRAEPETGVLEIWRRGGWTAYRAGRRQFMARDIWAYMNTLQVVCGVHCYHCATESDTVYYIRALHHWWNKEYSEHRSHLVAHEPHEFVQLTKHTILRRVVAQLDGVGWEKAKALDEHFDSVADVMAATQDELQAVKGIGPLLADRIRKQLWGM